MPDASAPRLPSETRPICTVMERFRDRLVERSAGGVEPKPQDGSTFPETERVTACKETRGHRLTVDLDTLAGFGRQMIAGLVVDQRGVVVRDRRLALGEANGHVGGRPDPQDGIASAERLPPSLQRPDQVIQHENHGADSRLRRWPRTFRVVHGDPDNTICASRPQPYDAHISTILEEGCPLAQRRRSRTRGLCATSVTRPARRVETGKNHGAQGRAAHPHVG